MNKYDWPDKRWPLRYRLTHRAHCWVNRIHYATGEHRVTQWLNDRLASLWVDWWIRNQTGLKVLESDD